MRRTLTFAACLLIAGIWARGEDPATKPSIKISAEAQAVIKDVASAYGKISSAELGGTVTGRFDVGGDKKNFDRDFKSAFVRGGGFRHEMRDDLIAGSTGKKVYVYHLRDRMFSQADAGASLPDDVDGLLRDQNYSLALALATDVNAELAKEATSIERGPDQNIDGAACAVLAIDGDVPLTLCFDATTHLLRQVTADFHKELIKRGAADVSRADVVTNYNAIKPGAAVDTALFAWTAPEGARDMASSAGLDQGGGAPSELVGKAAPDLALKGLDGQAFTLASHKGSVVVLDFWATWCGPCRAALPHLDAMYQEKHPAGLLVFAVDQGETEPIVKNFVKETSLGVPVILDPDGAGGAKYKVEGIPQTVVIGKDGVVKKVFVGFDEDGVKAAVDEAMAAK